jgi:hypothetical protein
MTTIGRCHVSASELGEVKIKVDGVSSFLSSNFELRTSYLSRVTVPAAPDVRRRR